MELTGANAATRLCAVTTVCFDIAALEIFLPACVGARLVVASEGTAADPAALAALLREQSVNMMQATPTTWRMLRASAAMSESGGGGGGGWPGDPELTAGPAAPPLLSSTATGARAEPWCLLIHAGASLSELNCRRL